jgi:hypothetical protein
MSKIDVLVRFEKQEDAQVAFEALSRAAGVIGVTPSAASITFSDGRRFIMDPFYSATRQYHDILVVNP